MVCIPQLFSTSCLKKVTFQNLSGQTLRRQSSAKRQKKRYASFARARIGEIALSSTPARFPDKAQQNNEEKPLGLLRPAFFLGGKLPNAPRKNSWGELMTAFQTIEET